MEEVLLYRKADTLPHFMAVRGCSIHDGNTALGRYLASRAVLAGYHRIARRTQVTGLVTTIKPGHLSATSAAAMAFF
jgi:hypothetical protein